jgi:hypothetical protein
MLRLNNKVTENLLYIIRENIEKVYHWEGK